MDSWRILLLNTQMEAGGAQKASLELAKGLKEMGHDVSVATLYDKADYVREFSNRYGLRIVDLHMKTEGGFTANTRHFLKGFFQLRRVLLEEKIDILQTFDFYSNAVGPLAARSAHIPVCVTSQRNSSRGAKRWLRTLIRFITNSRLVQMMTAVSEQTRGESVDDGGIHPDKVITIYNGIDVQRFALQISEQERSALLREIGIAEPAIVVTTVARLHPQKGHHYLLQAVPAVLKALPDAHFLFVGEGPLDSQIKEEISEAGLTANIHLVGARSDIPQLLAISQLFVLPSLWEGLPNVLLEAMAAGLPVVSTDVDGCAEVVVNGETGLLVSPASIDQLAEAIVRILGDELLATRFGAAGRERAELSFSQEKNLSSYVSLYSSLLSQEKDKG